MMIHLFNNQMRDYSILDTTSDICTENNQMENYDYLRECTNNLGDKNSGVDLVAAKETGLQGDNLDDVNLSSIDFMKIENLPKNTKESTKNKKEETKNISMDVNISYPNRHFNMMTLNLSNFLSKKSSNVSTSNTNESCIVKEDQISKQKKVENNCSVMSYTESTTDTHSIIKNNNYTNKNITSELRHAIKINNLELSDKNKEIQKCEQCLMTFRYKRHLDRHLKGHEKNNCPYCNEKFARRKHLEVHLFRAHGERVVKHSHLCDVCPKRFSRRALLNLHRAKHSYQNGKVCSECGDMISIDIDEKEHKENHCKKRQFKCRQCLQTFSTEQTYLSHIQNHDNYKCPYCDITFASKKRAYEHSKTVHISKLKKQESTNDAYYCADCKRMFLKKDDYFRHLKSALHLNNVTLTKAIFSCIICSKKLATQRALDQHVRRIHKNAKRFICNIYECTFQCARKTDLDRHKQLHVEERNIVCERCGKMFTSISILKDHVLYVHCKERHFICEKCGKTFKRNSLLKRHKLSHEQHRPFACTHCSTAFKRSHHLTRHMETCHKIILEKKKKVVKLMKTKDGHLVPVPNKSKNETDSKIKTESIPKTQQKDSATNTKKQAMNINLQMQPLLDSEENLEYPKLTLDSTNSSNVDSVSQVLSLVDINIGQVVTVEIINNLELPTNELINQSEINSNEVLNLSHDQNAEFQNDLLNTDQICYGNANYSDMSFENIEGSFPLVNNNCKMEMIENYLTHEFSPFLNI